MISSFIERKSSTLHKCSFISLLYVFVLHCSCNCIVLYLYNKGENTFLHQGM